MIFFMFASSMLSMYPNSSSQIWHHTLHISTGHGIPHVRSVPDIAQKVYMWVGRLTGLRFSLTVFVLRFRYWIFFPSGS